MELIVLTIYVVELTKCFPVSENDVFYQLVALAFFKPVFFATIRERPVYRPNRYTDTDEPVSRCTGAARTQAKAVTHAGDPRLAGEPRPAGDLRCRTSMI